MEDPELYCRAKILTVDIQNFFKEYKTKIKLRPDGKDSLLDIGCAGGNLIVDGILAILLPKTFSRLVGVDISKKMIEFGKERIKLPNVSFEILDIGGDITDFLLSHQHFDHITSTLCLHLVPNQQRALKNIFNLLQPNGDCLLYILVECVVLDAYGKMYKNWSKYMEDVDDYTSPYIHRFNPEYLLKKYLKNAGFTRYEIRMRERTLNFDSIEKFKEGYQSIMPFLHRMSVTEQSEFMEEFVHVTLELMKENSCLKSNDLGNGVGVNIKVPYTIMTAFIEKT